jgi:hypothetical protein
MTLEASLAPIFSAFETSDLYCANEVLLMAAFGHLQPCVHTSP